MGVAEPELFRDILYRLDFFRIDGEQRADAFAAKMQADYGAEAEEIAQSAATLSRLIPNVVYGRWFLVILLCDLLCVALLSLEWKNRKQKEVCIKRLLGCPTRRVGWEICLEYGAMVVAAGARAHCFVRLYSRSISVFWGSALRAICRVRWYSA